MNELEALAQRVSILERDLKHTRRTARRYRHALAGVVLVGLGLLAVGATNYATVSEVIQARRLEIVDDEGQLLLALSSGALGGQLDIWNNEKKNLVRLSGTAQGGDIALWNTAGTNAFGAYATRHGGETSIWNNDGQRVFRSSVKNDGGGQLDLGSETGTTVATITSIPEIGATFTILDAAGKRMFIAGTHQKGSAINLFNQQGVPMFIAGFGADGASGQIQLRNSRGNEIFAAGAGEEGDGLISIWRADGTKPRSFSSIR